MLREKFSRSVFEGKRGTQPRVPFWNLARNKAKFGVTGLFDSSQNSTIVPARFFKKIQLEYRTLDGKSHTEQGAPVLEFAYSPIRSGCRRKALLSFFFIDSSDGESYGELVPGPFACVEGQNPDTCVFGTEFSHTANVDIGADGATRVKFPDGVLFT